MLFAYFISNSSIRFDGTPHSTSSPGPSNMVYAQIFWMLRTSVIFIAGCQTMLFPPLPARMASLTWKWINLPSNTYKRRHCWGGFQHRRQQYFY
jgi:hypothetical protein